MAAAGRERRAERLNERLRGAQRTNIGDDSFNLNIEGLDQPAPEPPSSPRPGPSPSTTIGKRKRNDQDSAQSSRRRSATQSSTEKPPLAPAQAPTQSPPLPQSSSARSQQPDGASGSSGRSRRVSARAVSATLNLANTGADELDAVMAAPSLQSPPRSQQSRAILEEIEESPAHAPGSGRRRNLQLSAITDSTMRLQDTMSTDDMAPPSSSPLARKSRRSDGAASTTSRRSGASASRVFMVANTDESSLDQHAGGVAAEEYSLPEPIAEERVELENEELPEELEAEPAEDEVEQEEPAESARTLDRRRRTRNARASSPELGSGPAEAERQGEESDSDENHERDRTDPPAPRRAAQKTKKKTKSKPSTIKEPSKAKKQRRRKTAPDKADQNRLESGDGEMSEDEGEAIEITVQRFVNIKKRTGEEDEPDPLQVAIPFANRAGESVVDVLAQVCGEVITSTLAQFQQVADAADNVAKKKEYRIKMRALEAYRGELNSRFLQHAIHLDHWHSLRKQVRQVQKEKLSLREEILRLKGEREQVALRMDAVRIKHEADNKESTFRINTSALMQDIEVAIEQGQEAPELPREKQKDAEIANLELLLARVADEACSASSTGGMLHQVQDFNAFLERAAQALESRR
ncbi:hypothetical protein HIM_07412 [Hirsutella minnesotensis 3608]|uniref:Inner kinetochore subunit AME1 domain-containing protein n=1 Tax=Hirsutella minnesotensis 3608 TaxID=1043627 RepID=A0A0F7ZN66_9HYPO|nr:hypothetical protein HIM_07412 [Hirsutella minnesotensis 3608]